MRNTSDSDCNGSGKVGTRMINKKQENGDLMPDTANYHSTLPTGYLRA